MFAIYGSARSQQSLKKAIKVERSGEDLKNTLDEISDELLEELERHFGEGGDFD